LAALKKWSRVRRIKFCSFSGSLKTYKKSASPKKWRAPRRPVREPASFFLDLFDYFLHQGKRVIACPA